MTLPFIAGGSQGRPGHLMVGRRALLMRTLYQAHKDDHLTKADALRHAQLALLHGSVHADPTTKSARGGTSRRIVDG